MERFKESDLVSVYINTIYGNQPIWLRVMFIDNDDTFIGKVEKKGSKIESYQNGNDYRFANESVIDIYNGQQFCYSDNVSICSCPGTCREK